MAFIYALSDPRTDEVRYVGQTAEQPETRLRKHTWPSTLRRERNHRTKWVNSLIADGVQPKIEVVEVVSEDQKDEAERFYIAYFRSLGFQLVNQQEGGEGWTKGQKRGPLDEAHRRAISAGVRAARPNRNTEAVRQQCLRNLAAINARKVSQISKENV